MKVKYLGKSDPLTLLNGQVYDVVSIEKDWYRIIDESSMDYLYPPECFEIVQDDNKTMSGCPESVSSDVPFIPLKPYAVILKAISNHDYSIHFFDEPAYSYLDEDGVSIVISNADPEHELTIDYNEDSYILYFGDYHEHYDSSVETNELLRAMDDILHGRKCAISIFYNQEEEPHYLGSQLTFSAQALNAPAEELFGSIYTIPEFRKKLNKFGGNANIQFWDTVMDRTIVIKPDNHL